MTTAGARAALALAVFAGVFTLPARADTQEAVAAMKAGRSLEAAAELHDNLRIGSGRVRTNITDQTVARGNRTAFNQAAACP